MPPLAGIIDQREDMRAQMAFASQIGGNFGSYFANKRKQEEKQAAEDKIKEHEEREILAQQLYISTLDRAAQEDWPADRVIAETAKLPELTNSEFGRRKQMELMEQQQQQRMAQQFPKGIPYGVSPEQYAEANRAKVERDISGSGGGDNILSGPNGMKYLYDPETKTAKPIEGMAAAGGAGGEDTGDLEKQYNAWLVAYKKTFDDFGTPIEELNDDREFAKSQIAAIRQKIQTSAKTGQRPSTAPPGGYAATPIQYEPEPANLPTPGQQPAEKPSAAPIPKLSTGPIVPEKATPVGEPAKKRPPSAGTPEFEAEMASVPKEKRAVSKPVIDAFISDAIRRMPGASKEEVIAEAKRMAKLHGWVIE